MVIRPKPDYSIFHQWRNPAEVRDLCNEVIDGLEAKSGEFEILIGSGLQPLRDAVTAADVGITYGRQHPGVQVLLIPEGDRRPDFQLREAGGSVLTFEATEAYLPGRSRGVDYKKIREMPKQQRGLELVGGEQMIANQAKVEEVFAARVKDKAGKRYLDEAGQVVTPHLLIRDNLHHDHAGEALAAMVENWKESFPSIWVLAKNLDLIQLWPKLKRLPGGDFVDRLSVQKQ
ncbi:MAG: hypothetical protein OEW39_02600 [Deltaproteobacteria bacterium]|nr:hypothetical protein [Deltaproteobacteria bacterium]